jgi:hypothetical protein
LEGSAPIIDATRGCVAWSQGIGLPTSIPAALSCTDACPSKPARVLGAR